MSIRITNPKSKMPRGLKLAGQITTYLFEEGNGECDYMKDSEVEALRKAIKAITSASARTSK